MKSSRALVAFAYVADQFAKTNDIAAGLMPLFAPLIAARAGTIFSPKQFAADVKQTYDLDIHPYVAEDFAPALTKAGFLSEKRRPGEVVQYTNNNCQIPEPPIREEQLRALVNGFIGFATEHLRRFQLTAPPEDIETAFLDRLIRPDFVALILRPDNPLPSQRTLSLKRPGEDGAGATNRVDDHFDYLVARYILNLSTQDTSQFDLLVSATSGSLVAEVILDLQHPPSQGEPLSGAEVAVDSPLVLDALGLGLDGATDYAKQLIEQIKAAGATPIVFDATLEEIRRAVRSPLQNYERGLDLYGPLGRRLRFNSSLAPYIRALLPKISEEIEQLGISIRAVSAIDRAQLRQFFSETNEAALAGRIGEYPSEEARQHDARAVADVLRLRGPKKSTTIKEAKIVFVTRNGRLARLSRRFLDEKALMSRDYFPPCITDRYLAGLLWISLGGGGDSLSRLRLVANCSAAIVPRRDIVLRMHRFFEDTNPRMVQRFEALMTNERAEHFLMDRTLADATLITQDNFEEIYRDIEEVAAERVTTKKNEEIAALTKKHEEQLETLDASHRQRYMEESARAVLLEDAARATAAQAAALAREKESIANQLSENERRWALTCMRAGKRAAVLSWAVLAVSLALASSGISLIQQGSPLRTAAVGCGTFLIALIASVLGNRFWPENPVERWIISRRSKAVASYARRHGIEGLLARFNFNWDTMTPEERISNPSTTLPTPSAGGIVKSAKELG